MKMAWDFEDRLHQVDLGGGGTAYYVYDAGGQRVRKVIKTQNGARKHERIYLHGFEVYREFESDGNTVKLKRESLHITDDKQRIALVETRTQGAEPAVPAQLIRYQFGNHLSSASLELDQGAALISYEEYHPYGVTSFQTGRSAAEVSLKRYRCTGMERDEETGLYYHQARYYAAWLGRWTACDPIGIADDMNLYCYVRDNPLTFIDPKGTYHESVHYYTTFFIAMAAGYSFEDAARIATYANLPDEWQPLDSETYSARESSLIGVIRGTAESPANLPGSHGSRVVNEGIHAFDSGQGRVHTAQQEQEIRQRIVGSTARDLERSRTGADGRGDERTFAQLGFAVHASGDAYAHSRLENEAERYEHVWGHGGPGFVAGFATFLGGGGSFTGFGIAIGSAAAIPPLAIMLGIFGLLLGLILAIEVARDQIPAPDNPGRRPQLYGQHVRGLLNAFLSARGGTSRLTPAERDEFIGRVTSTENEADQIRIIRAEFSLRFGVEMPDYEPEEADAGAQLSNIPNVTRDPALLREAARLNFEQYQEAIR